MKASLCSTILMIGLALIFQGCGELRTDKSPADTQPAQKLVSDLQSTLAQSRENLDREKETQSRTDAARAVSIRKTG